MTKILKWLTVTGVLMMIAANVIAVLTGGFSLPTFLLGGLGLIFFLSIAFLGDSTKLADYIRFFLNVVFLLGAFVFLYLIFPTITRGGTSRKTSSSASPLRQFNT